MTMLRIMNFFSFCAAAALNWACETALATRLERVAPATLHLDAAELPFELQRRMIWQCLKEIN
ncbi:MAG: hypothetical protein ACK440_10965, partial [Sphingomonadaceae bacterium]